MHILHSLVEGFGRLTISDWFILVFAAAIITIAVTKDCFVRKIEVE